MEFVAIGGHKGLVLKAIDAPDREPPDTLAANILGELAAATPDTEVAFVDGVRRVPNTAPEAAPVEPLAEIRPGATWVVTGGGAASRQPVRWSSAGGSASNCTSWAPVPCRRFDPACATFRKKA